jgi:hypothetical protein
LQNLSIGMQVEARHVPINYAVTVAPRSMAGPTEDSVCPATEGPLFRRLYKGGRVGTGALSADQVARIVQRRAHLAGMEGDWAAHSLRSGFVTEAGRQGVPLGEVMAMTEHRSVGDGLLPGWLAIEQPSR